MICARCQIILLGDLRFDLIGLVHGVSVQKLIHITIFICAKFINVVIGILIRLVTLCTHVFAQASVPFSVNILLTAEIQLILPLLALVVATTLSLSLHIHNNFLR